MIGKVYNGAILFVIAIEIQTNQSICGGGAEYFGCSGHDEVVSLAYLFATQAIRAFSDAVFSVYKQGSC